MASLSGAWDDIKNFFGGVGNALEGNPAGATDQLNQLMKTAFAQGQGINQTLQREKAQSTKYYQPMQQMFGTMYGTGGIKPAVAPGVPGSTSLPSMFQSKPGGAP